jgi:hypothetical protein
MDSSFQNDQKKDDPDEDDHDNGNHHIDLPDISQKILIQRFLRHTPQGRKNQKGKAKKRFDYIQLIH